MSLTTKRRPTTLENMYPTTNLSYFEDMVRSKNYPNVMLFHGAPGTGKTTLARIIAARILGLDDETTKELVFRGNDIMLLGYVEQDFTREGLANQIRTLGDQIKECSGPQLDAKNHVFVLDEFDAAEKESQKRLVKPIDDNAVDHVYLILISNNMHKIEETILSRCRGSITEFTELYKDYAIKAIMDISKLENRPVDKTTAERIYLSVPIKSPRDLILQLSHYLTTGELGHTTDQETGLIKLFLNEVVGTIRIRKSGTKKSNDALDIQTGNLYIAASKLIYSKKSYNAAAISIMRYLEGVLKNNTSYKRLSFITTTINKLSEVSAAQYTYPVLEMMKSAYNIIEERVKIEINEKDLDDSNR